MYAEGALLANDTTSRRQLLDVGRLQASPRNQGAGWAPRPESMPKSMQKMAMLGHVGRRFAPFSGPRVVEVMALLWLAAWTSPLLGRAHAARGRLLDAMLLSAL